MTVPTDRIRIIQAAPPAFGRYVLYWMVGTRRTASNYALDRAVEWCRELARPLLIFEPLSCRFPWSALRFHQFVVGGMMDNRAACNVAGVGYFPFVSPGPEADRGLLEALAREASLVVTDDVLSGTVPEILKAAAPKLGVRCEAVDAAGLIPFRKPRRAFHTAVSFRRYAQRELPDELAVEPNHDPLSRAAEFGIATVPESVLRRYTSHPLDSDSLSQLPIDRVIGTEPRAGGRKAGLRLLRRFLQTGVNRYGERGILTDETHSRLSPYLHFGHIGPHDVLRELSRATGWMPPFVWPDANGARHGWWDLPKPHEAFLDEVVTWRELSINSAAWLPRYKDYEGLPEWAISTLQEHEEDRRPWIYDLEVLETAQTHDPLWNAAQTQLVREGYIHPYLRMLWGKKILEWTASPREAFHRMIYLNDAYATDGRDPNSYSGISWILGRYDHPWVERPVFGQVRYMSSDRTMKKFEASSYIERYAAM